MTTSPEPEPLKEVPETDTSECTTVTSEAMMEQQSDECAEQQSTESEIKVCLTSLWIYPTDPANFRDIKINAALRAEIVRYGPCNPVESVNVVFPKDAKDRSFHQSLIKRIMFLVTGWFIP